MSGKQRRSQRKSGFAARGVAAGNPAPDEAVGAGFAPSGPLRSETASARDTEIRLGCLRAAIELRSAGSAPGDLLVTAAAFYEFVTGARDAAREQHPIST